MLEIPLQILENNSGKICFALIGTTLAGGAILMFGTPAFVAACVTMHTVEIITIASGGGAVASGLSYLRRENAKKNQQEQAHNEKEDSSRSKKLFEAAKATIGTTIEENNASFEKHMSNFELKTEAEFNSIRSELRFYRGMLNTISHGLSCREIDDERRQYEAGKYSDNDSSDEEDKKDQEFNLSG